MSRPGSRPRFPSWQRARAWKVNQSLRATFALAGWPACVRQGSPSLCGHELNGGDKWIGMPQSERAPPKGCPRVFLLRPQHCAGTCPSRCGVQSPPSTLLGGLEISSHATALSADLRRRRRAWVEPLVRKLGARAFRLLGFRILDAAGTRQAILTTSGSVKQWVTRSN